MIKQNDLFFHFLRKGLFPSNEEYQGTSPKAEDWENVFKLAHEQAVSGLIMDGIGHSKMRPKQFLWEKQIVNLLQLEEMNKMVNECGKKWLERLKHSGISAFIFKGSSVAEQYAEPLHRCVGDIDIVVQNGWEKLAPLLTRNRIDFRNEHGDLVLTDGQLTIEFHNKWEYTYNPQTNRCLQKWCRSASTENRELYLVCLILHVRRHFLTYGIGLKQICDIAVMLQNKTLDLQKLKQLLQDVDAEKFCRVLFGFIEVYLGGNLELPLHPIKSGQDFNTFYHVVMNEGYMLKEQQKSTLVQNEATWKRIFKNTVFWIKRAKRLYHLMPAESGWFLIYMIGRRIRKTVISHNILNNSNIYH